MSQKRRPIYGGDYGLTVVLFGLFWSFWLVQSYAGYQAHIEGDDALYLWKWLEATTENWQSESLQVALTVFLTTHLIHKNSPQSRDSADRLEDKIDELLRRTDGA